LRAFEGSETARDFHFDLHHPQVLFGQIVGEGHVEVSHEPQGFGFERLEPFEQIVAGALFGASSREGFRLQFGQLAMEGQTEPNRGPIALDEGREGLRREGASAGLARLVDGGVGVQEHGAHEFGPGLLFDVDEGLEFAQDMGVAERVIDRVHPAIGQEVVVHDDAPLQILGDVAALFARAIESEGQARRRVQPMQLASDPIAGFVEMANPGLGHVLADGLVDLAQLSRLLAHPSHEAGRTDPWRAEQIAQRLRGAILGDQAALTKTSAEVIAIDGKTVRRSYQKKGAEEPIHVVSAFAARQRMVLGQTKVADKSNEIIAIPALLELLAIEGAVVTIDAMGCQRAIAQKIIDKKAGYILALKGNQGTLRDDVELFASEQKAAGFKDTTVSRDETVDGDHGRIETRTVTVFQDVEWLQKVHQWPGLKSVVMVESKRESAGKIESETRFYVTSLVLVASVLGPMI